jgi:hypothetical protein
MEGREETGPALGRGDREETWQDFGREVPGQPSSPADASQPHVCRYPDPRRRHRQGYPTTHTLILCVTCPSDNMMSDLRTALQL